MRAPALRSFGITAWITVEGEQPRYVGLADLLRANRDDAGLIADLRDAWHRRRSFAGRRCTLLRVGGGAAPLTTISLHRFDR